MTKLRKPVPKKTFLAKYTAILSEELHVRASSPEAAMAAAEKMARDGEIGSDMTIERATIRIKSNKKQKSDDTSEIVAYIANELDGGFVTPEGKIAFTWNGRTCVMSVDVTPDDTESSSSIDVEIPEYERMHNMLR